MMLWGSSGGWMSKSKLEAFRCAPVRAVTPPGRLSKDVDRAVGAIGDTLG
jgi:hypothetical protein